MAELKKRFETAKAVKSHFDAMLNAMVSRLGFRDGQVVKAALKKPKRMLKKAARNNGLDSVTDLVRGSIICDNIDQMERAVAYIATAKHISVDSFLNGFKELDFIHYRCLTIVTSIAVKVPNSTGIMQHPVELQLHLKQFYDLKLRCETPRWFFLEQGGLSGNEAELMLELKKRMDVVYALGSTPVLLSVFLIYIKYCTSKLSDEERDEANDVNTCPPMPPSLHFLYQEALWGSLEGRVRNPSELLSVLQQIAFVNMKNGNCS